MARAEQEERVAQEVDPKRLAARQARRYRWAWRLTWILPLLGLVILATWAAGAATGWRVALGWSAGLALVAGAAMATGGLLGFLFGVPKVLSETATTGSGSPPSTESPELGAIANRATPHASQAATETRTRITYAVRGDGGISQNTNLEQISDWLTKILVGVGLVQIGQAPDAFGRLVGAIAKSVNAPGAEHVIGSVLVFFAISGFLVAYLLTRLVLTGAFRAVDQQPEEDGGQQ